MKLDLTKPMQTRSGRKAAIIKTDLKAETHTVVAVVEGIAGGDETVEVYTPNGIFTDSGEESGWDLINVPGTVEVTARSDVAGRQS